MRELRLNIGWKGLSWVLCKFNFLFPWFRSQCCLTAAGQLLFQRCRIFNSLASIIPRMLSPWFVVTLLLLAIACAVGKTNCALELTWRVEPGSSFCSSLTGAFVVVDPRHYLLSNLMITQCWVMMSTTVAFRLGITTICFVSPFQANKTMTKSPSNLFPFTNTDNLSTVSMLM